jgi:GNAT superfamily N-acetyltransferase
MTGLALALRRSAVGAGTALWAGPSGVTIEADRWVALSGAPTVEYNAALVHAGGGVLERTADEVLAAGAPAVVMAAGRALDDVGGLQARHWMPIGSVALMLLEPLVEARQPPRAIVARRLRANDRAGVTRIIGEVFGVGTELGAVAISGVSAGLDGHALWGAFDGATLVSCLATVRVGETVTVWSMATQPVARRRGYGAAALGAALASAAADGATGSLLYSSPDGEPLYRSLGYRELERWQQWSRPRWVLARG